MRPRARSSPVDQHPDSQHHELRRLDRHPLSSASITSACPSPESSRSLGVGRRRPSVRDLTKHDLRKYQALAHAAPETGANRGVARSTPPTPFATGDVIGRCARQPGRSTAAVRLRVVRSGGAVRGGMSGEQRGSRHSGVTQDALPRHVGSGAAGDRTPPATLSWRSREIESLSASLTRGVAPLYCDASFNDVSKQGCEIGPPSVLNCFPALSTC
jgi:hypothetical protein